jgi:hypothetical protein
MNKEELFNLRHASARNVVERIFGVVKRRFRILLLSPEYKMDIQARIPAALCAIHNFIRDHDPNEGTLPEGSVFNYDNPDHQGQPDSNDSEQAQVHNAARQHANATRDRIAQEMWDDYQAILHERGLMDTTHTLDIDVDSEDDSDDGTSSSNGDNDNHDA